MWRPETTIQKRRVFRKALRVGLIFKIQKMKKVMTILGAILFTSFILSSCGSSIDNNSWSGNDVIAGVEFNYKFETKSDNTYTLVGDSGGMSVNENGTYRKVSDTEIILTSGNFNGCKFVKEGSSLKMYLDNGGLFMSLH